MKRNDFLKMLTGGAIGAAFMPQILKADAPIQSEDEKKYPAVAIDYNTISHVTFGGRKISAAEILKIYKQTGMLIYKSIPSHNAPIVLQGTIKAMKF